MALVNCPKCGKEITDNATRCYHCGAVNTYKTQTNNNNKEVSTSNVIVGILVVIAIFVGIYFLLEHINPTFEHKVDTSKLANYDMIVDIGTLTETYYNNELAGNQKYKDKRIKITGKLNNTDVDDSVLLSSGTTCYLDSGKHYDVACNFKDGDASKLSDYSRGENITIIGKVKELRNGFPNKVVYLEECIVCQ